MKKNLASVNPPGPLGSPTFAIKALDFLWFYPRLPFSVSDASDPIPGPAIAKARS